MINIEVTSAEHTTHTLVSADVQTTAAHLAFMLCGQLYAADLRDIIEVRQPPVLTRVAHAPPYILGVASLRGEIVPVVNLRIRFALPIQDSEQSIQDDLILVTEIEGKRTAVMVDAISDVIEIDLAQISKIPKSTMAVDIRYLKGMVQIDEKILLIIDMTKLLTFEELHASLLKP
jgi:purine-binding chemotaxis protein CheW